ncbi:MAG: cohesin domain-containing protein [Patescibacteria group bacterium]
MRKDLVLPFLILLFFGGFFWYSQPAFAASGATLSISPASGTVLYNSTFEASIYMDTRGESINAVELNLKFPPDKLSIIKPSGGESFFSIWPEVPVYSNTDGTVKLVGGIPNGIITESGLITTITFKAKQTGQATIEILPSSKVLANDGRGTDVLARSGRGTFTIKPRPPGGVKVFSETHPFEDQWYNNNNPIFTWEKDAGVTDFSFVLDNKPQTIPDNNTNNQDTIKAYEELDDGLWYFHVKAKKRRYLGYHDTLFNPYRHCATRLF